MRCAAMTMLLLTCGWLQLLGTANADVNITDITPPPASLYNDSNANTTSLDDQLVYIVTLVGKPTVQAYADVFNNSRAGGTRTKNKRRIMEANSYSQNLTNAQDSVLADSLENGTYEAVYSFTSLINAVGVILTDPSQVEALQSATGVQRLEKDVVLLSHTTHTPSLLGLDVPSTGLWSAAGGGPDGAGEGIIIALVDTGVNPMHPSVSDAVAVPYNGVPSTFLGICQTDNDTFPPGSCNNKLIGAQFFADSALAYNFIDPNFDFVSPLDGSGHGSHTSAIAAGNHGVEVLVDGMPSFGFASGIAPRARLSSYKCIFRQGGLMSDCIAAVEQAVMDGVNVVNLSLGPSSPPSGITFLSSFDWAMLLAVKSGVVVVQSAGNYGPAPGTLASFSPWIISVGATITDRQYPVYLTLGSGVTLTGLGFSGGPMPNSAMVSSADVAYPNSTSGFLPTDCQVSDDLDINLVAGNLLLCFYSPNFDSGTSVVSQVTITARELNASGFVLIASDPTLNFPIYFDELPFIIPGIFLPDLQSSQIVMNYYDSPTELSPNASISIPSDYNAQFNYTTPVVADFSSRGPTVSNSDVGDIGDVLKPDIVAPGSQIWSAWTYDGIDLPYWNSVFATRTGTSQAAPHVAGVVALIKQKNPSWSPAAIQSALVTTARKVDSLGQPIKAMFPANDPFRPLGPATPYDMGGGFLNPSAVLDPGLIFDRGFSDYVNFLCTTPGAQPDDILALTGMTCNLPAGAYASDLNMPSITIVKLQGSRQVVRTATSVGKVTENYKVSIVMPKGVSVSVSPSNFTVAPGAKTNFTANFKVITPAPLSFSFGWMIWKGNAGHVVSLPLTIIPIST